MEEGRSATTNYRCVIMGSQTQYKYQQLKKTLFDDFGVVKDEIYMKIKVQKYNISKYRHLKMGFAINKRASNS